MSRSNLVLVGAAIVGILLLLVLFGWLLWKLVSWLAAYLSLIAFLKILQDYPLETKERFEEYSKAMRKVEHILKGEDNSDTHNSDSSSD